MRFLPTLEPGTTISEDGLVMIRTDRSTGERVLVHAVTDETLGRAPGDLTARLMAREYIQRAREAVAASPW